MATYLCEDVGADEVLGQSALAVNERQRVSLLPSSRSSTVGWRDSLGTQGRLSCGEPDVDAS